MWGCGDVGMWGCGDVGVCAPTAPCPPPLAFLRVPTIFISLTISPCSDDDDDDVDGNVSTMVTVSRFSNILIIS